MSDKILFSIPNYWYLHHLNQCFIELQLKEPEKFYDDVIVDSVYGAFPGCTWNGGRWVSGSADGNEIKDISYFYNRYGISMRNTFTNSLIGGTDVYDTICNAVLKIQDDTFKQTGTRNGCTIASEELMQYIEKNYPNFYTVWSTTKEIFNLDTVNQLSENKLMVLSYNYNNRFDLLSQLKHPENIEIVIEEGCVEHCPDRKDHYLMTSHMNKFEPYTPFVCQDHKNATTYYYTHIFPRDYYMSIEDIRTRYLPLGINKFKISGRSEHILAKINTIESYVLYFVKPEYQNDIRNKLLANEFTNKMITI